MDEQDTAFNSHKQLFEELLKLTQSKSSGTLIVNINDGKMARFLFNSGEIASIHHDEHNGVETFPGIRTIKGGTYSFIEGFDMDKNQPDLPETGEILSMLREETEIEVSSGEYNHLIGEVRLELTKNVGPIAEVLVQEYLQAKGSPVSLDDFSAMLEVLASNIPNDEKAEEFTVALFSKAR